MKIEEDPCCALRNVDTPVRSFSESLADKSVRVTAKIRIAAPFSVPLAFSNQPSHSRSMAAVEIDVSYVAHLARISLSSEEGQKLGAQLGQILGYIEKLNELDVSQVEPTAHAIPLVNVTRPDEIRASLSNEDALRNAPAQANGLFVVPKIVE